MSDRSPQRITALVEQQARRLGGTVGIAARNLATGREVLVRADERFPLASVFKVPLMVTVMRRVDAGEVALAERLALRERDKSPGSTLMHCHEGLTPTVRDLIYLMITLSDNTATDMLWRRVGPRAVNVTMRGLGLHSLDCWCPNRGYFLIETGLGAAWRDLGGEDIVARFTALDDAGRRSALAAVEKEYAGLAGAEFLRLYEQRFGYGEGRDYERCYVIDQALDNQGSPRDLLDLLAMIAEDRCASPSSCALMVDVLAHQEWRAKIPAGLPGDVRVANKTGGVAGTSNDAAIVFPSQGGPLVLVVFYKGLHTPQVREEAAAAIAALAGALYEELTEEGR